MTKRQKRACRVNDVVTLSVYRFDDWAIGFDDKNIEKTQRRD